MTDKDSSLMNAIREMVDGLSIPFSGALPPGVEPKGADSVWRDAPYFVTDRVARDLWLEWNPDQALRIEKPSFFRAFRDMLREIAGLGFKLDRFRAASRALRAPGENQKEWMNRFEEVIDTTRASLRISLSPDRLQSFKRTNQDEKASGRTWDDLLKLMSDGLFYELGLTFPPITVAADESLGSAEFRCEWNDLRLPPSVGLDDGQILVNDTPERLRLLNIDGQAAINPGNGNQGAIVDATFNDICEQAGLTTWDTKGYVTLAASGVLRKAAASFVTRSLIDLYMFRLGDFDQDLVELTDATIDRSLLVQILRGLLAEEISIRNLPAILNRLLQARATMRTAHLSHKYILFDVFPFTHAQEDRRYEDLTPRDHVESVRSSLKRHISHKYTRGQNSLIVYLIDNKLERRLRLAAPFDEQEHAQFIEGVRDEVGSLPPTSQAPVLLTSVEIRHRLWRELHPEFKDLVVLSYQELSPELNIQPIARINPEDEPQEEDDDRFLRLVRAIPSFPELKLTESVEVAARTEGDRALLALLESQRETILDKTKSKILAEHRDEIESKESLDETIRPLLGRVIDSYKEFLATDQTTNLDGLYTAMSPVMKAERAMLSFLVEVPLVIAEVIRDILAQSQHEANEDALKKFNQAVDRAAAVAYRLVERLVVADTDSKAGKFMR
jgi:hypothetical protein